MGSSERYPVRRSPRLRGFDYSTAGAYFITIVTFDRRPLLGEVKGDAMALSKLGEAVEQRWSNIPAVSAGVELDQFVVMPDHFHGILILNGDSSLPRVMQSFKSVTTADLRRLHPDAGPKLWQGRYVDRIIRDDRELDRIRDYVRLNPVNWRHERNEDWAGLESLEVDG